MRVVLFRMAIVLGLVASAGCKSPEEKLAAHIEEANDILEDNHKDPKAGLESLRTYLRKNLPDMAEAWGELIAELDGLSGKELEARTAEIAKVLKDPLEDLVKVTDEFEDVIDETEEARDWLNDLAMDYAKTMDIKLLTELGRTFEKAVSGSRDKKCRKAVAHFADLMEVSMKGIDSPEVKKQIQDMRDGDPEMLEHCRRQTAKQTDCMLNAETMEEAAKCAR